MPKQVVQLTLDEEFLDKIKGLAKKNNHSIEEEMEKIIIAELKNSDDPIFFLVRHSDVVEQIEDFLNRKPTEDEVTSVFKEMGGLYEALTETVYPVIEDEIENALEELGLD